MDDEALLRALGEIVREKSGEPEGPLAQALSRYQRGQLSEAELAKLRSELETPNSFDQVQAAMRPFSESFQAKLQSAVEEQIRPKKPFGWALLGRWQMLAAAASCAVLVVVVLFWSQGPPSTSLPSYEFTVSGVVKQTRHGLGEPKPSAPDVVHAFKHGAQAVFVLRPFEAVTDPVQAVVFLQRAGTWQRLSLPTEVDARGAVRIQALIGDELKLAKGEHTLWIGIAMKHSEIASEITNLDSVNQWPHFSTRIRIVAPEEHP